MEWTETQFDRQRREMVDSLRRNGIQNPWVLEAFQEVRRHLFVPEEGRAHAYDDAAWPIGYGQTISQPFTVAYMTSLLADHVPGGSGRPFGRVLEIGTGSGYQAAILEAIGYSVFSVERLPVLYHQAKAKFHRFGLPITCRLGDGTLGWPEEAPFDGIIVSAGAPSEPKALKEQLDENGSMVIPVGSRGMQVMTLVTRKGEQFEREQYQNFAFVPLAGREGWDDKDTLLY